jgi:hypothetical protein
MRKVYSAQNSMEAHIVRGLLEQQGIAARVNGEYLQGGIGELPLIDLVTVSVADEDYSRAVEVIREFDQSSADVVMNDDTGLS